MYRNTEPFYFKPRSRSQAPCGSGVVESQSPKALAASVLSICRLARFRLFFRLQRHGVYVFQGVFCPKHHCILLKSRYDFFGQMLQRSNFAVRAWATFLMDAFMKRRHEMGMEF